MGFKDILEWKPWSCINCPSKVQINSSLHWKRYSCLKANQNLIHISWPTKIQNSTRPQKQHQTSKLWKQPHELSVYSSSPFQRLHRQLTDWFAETFMGTSIWAKILAKQICREKFAVENHPGRGKDTGKNKNMTCVCISEWSRGTRTHELRFHR